MATKTKAKRTAYGTPPMTFEERATKILEVARVAAGTAHGRENLWNAVYGVGAPFSQLFPTQAEREAFARTEESRQIDEMLEQLRAKDAPPDRQARFVLRLPRTILEALKAEAAAEGVSVNQLCLAKLATRLRQNLFLKC